jgi:hypothetical protein
LIVFAREIAREDYAPGSSYPPRVEAVLRASRTGARGGPFATVREGEGYRLAPGLLNDLGMAAVADLWGRVTGRPLTRLHLALFNLAVMAVALFGLVLVVPPRVRLALVVLFAAVPLCVREYRSPDSVAIHGALAALALALVVAPHHRWPSWTGLIGGLLLFVVHKIRSPFGLFAVAAIVAAFLVIVLRTRSLRAWRWLAFAALAFVALEVPWRMALDRRAEDPRVLDRDILRAHNVYNPLVSGIGWTENRWGIQPWDPKVVEFLATRTGKPPVGLETFESERRAREVYLALWHEAPGYLLGFYWSRLPTAIRQYVWLGYWGAALWILAATFAWAGAWRARDSVAIALLVAPVVVAAGLATQIALIDPRLLYSYPLRFVSAFGLLTSVALVVANRRLASGERSDGREQRRSEEAELRGADPPRTEGRPRAETRSAV